MGFTEIAFALAELAILAWGAGIFAETPTGIASPDDPIFPQEQVLSSIEIPAEPGGEIARTVVSEGLVEVMLAELLIGTSPLPLDDDNQLVINSAQVEVVDGGFLVTADYEVTVKGCVGGERQLCLGPVIESGSVTAMLNMSIENWLIQTSIDSEQGLTLTSTRAGLNNALQSKVGTLGVEGVRKGLNYLLASKVNSTSVVEIIQDSAVQSKLSSKQQRAVAKLLTAIEQLDGNLSIEDGQLIFSISKKVM